MTNRDTLMRILELLSTECLNLNMILHKLKISKGELDAGLTILEAHGFIERIDYEDKCDTCPIYDKCNSRRPTLYRITQKGLRTLSRKQS